MSVKEHLELTPPDTIALRQSIDAMEDERVEDDKGSDKSTNNDDMLAKQLACSGGQQVPCLEPVVRAAWKRKPPGWVSMCITDYRESKQMRSGPLDRVQAQELNDYLNVRRGESGVKIHSFSDYS